MASTFPTSIDVIPQWLNVTTTDSTLLNEFQNAMRIGDFSTANAKLIQIENYSQKVINATNLNKLRDCILAIEQFYGTNVQPYIQAKQIEWEAIINLFSYIQTWDSITQFYKNNMVSWTNEGLTQLYICIATPPSVGINPLNETYFRVFTIQGKQGESAVGATTFAFNWNSATTYAIDTIVYYDGSWWISLQTTTNNQPVQGSAYWDLVLKAPQVIYPIQSAQPTDQTIGELWFELLS